MADSLDDAALFDAWTAGDRKAGAELFERHFDPLYGFFRNKLRECAEDLTQQTFLALVESRDRFRRESSFRTFLFATARNVLRYELRKRARGRVEPDFDSQSLDQLSPTPGTIMDAKRDRQRLLEALRRIPVDHQIALELYHFEGMSAREVAGVLGIEEPAMRSRLRRATAALQRVLGELASSRFEAESTLAGLDAWADELRAELRRRG